MRRVGSNDEWRSALPKLINAVGENATLSEQAKPHLADNPKYDDEFLPLSNSYFTGYVIASASTHPAVKASKNL